MAVPVLHGDGCQPGLHHDPVRPGTVQFGQRALVRCAALQGEAVPEGPEAFLLVAGDDAVGHRAGYAPLPSFLDGACDVFVSGVAALGDGPEGLLEGGLIEGVVRGGLGHEGYHFLPAGAVGLLAILVVAAAQHSSLLATVSAGAGQRVDDFSQGHVSPELYLGIPISGQAI